jgi:hypothetical protein
MRASELIHEARDYHPAFHPHAIPDDMLLRRLSTMQRHIVQAVARLAEEALAARITIDQAELLASLDGTGIEIDGLLALSDVSVRFMDREILHPIALVAHANRHDPGVWPSAWIAGRRLHLIDKRHFGEIAHGWEEAAELVVLATITPPEIADDGTELVLDAAARTALVLDLVRFMAVREPDAQRAVASEIAAAGSELESLIQLYAFGTAPMGWRVK